MGSTMADAFRTEAPADSRSDEERRPVQVSSEGVGKLLQRDYVAVVRDSRHTPEALMDRVRREFPRFSPSALAEFSRPHGSGNRLEVGDTMRVHIRGAGPGGVVVTLADPQSFTLRPLKGHLEAGRITFGAHYDEAGHLVCRIRNRSRISDPIRYVGYLLLGIHAQTLIWSTFLERMAEESGGRLIGRVLVSTQAVPDLPADRGEAEEPTFRWTGAPD
jgi:hypothetical protein